MPAAAAIPYIVAASTVAGTAYSIYSANKQRSALEDQYAQSRQDSLGIQGQQTGLANKLIGGALPGVNKAAGYYSTLLSGDRGQMRLATAGQRGAVNDSYRGAERGATARLTGGARDTALAELERDRAGHVAGLTTGVQGDAADKLGQLSSGLLGTGSTSLGNAGLTSANLLGAAGTNMRFGQEAGANSAAGWGKLLASLMNQFGGKSGGTSSLLPAQILAPRYSGMPNVSPSGNMGDA